jgi:transcriptional repressor NrdR
MKCPSCGCVETQVKDSRAGEDGGVIRRRRSCLACNGRFTTFERVQLREIMVLKRDQSLEVLDREKIMRALEISLRKRPIAREKIDRLVSDIMNAIQDRGEKTIASDAIGGLILDELASLDQVAYVRFASVYHDFKDIADFTNFLNKIEL